MKAMGGRKCSDRSAPSELQPRRAVVLGIDPGLERTGYAALSAGNGRQQIHLLEAGLVRLPRRQSMAQRLAHLADSVETLIHRDRPAVLVCEELYAHYRHPRTAILMAHARGVILASAARCELEVLSIAARRVKKLLTGSGGASKRQLQRAVAATLCLPVIPEPDDVADAIAIALCGLRLWLAPGGDVSGAKVRA